MAESIGLIMFPATKGCGYNAILSTEQFKKIKNLVVNMKFSYLILYLAIKHIRVVEIVNYIGTVCMYYVKKNRAITKYARKNTQMKEKI